MPAMQVLARDRGIGKVQCLHSSLSPQSDGSSEQMEKLVSPPVCKTGKPSLIEGSNPSCSTKLAGLVSNGSTSVFQTNSTGSNPVARSKSTQRRGQLLLVYLRFKSLRAAVGCSNLSSLFLVLFLLSKFKRLNTSLVRMGYRVRSPRIAPLARRRVELLLLPYSC